jgi:hypothetical protein
LKEEFVKMLLTSGYSTKVLAFLIKSSLESEVKVNLESGDNLSWIVKHPSLENVFYATHEVESGAVSRWKIDEEGKLNMLEVCTIIICAFLFRNISQIYNFIHIYTIDN